MHTTRTATGRRWRVWATAYDLTNHTFPATEPREEIIEPDNELFASCQTPWEVEDTYEAFWNRLNPSDLTRPYSTHTPTEKIKVIAVQEA